jgi:DNA-directed RNA polymerase I subunit RPA49
MSEKKRKRREDGGERPTKKVAIASKGNVQVQLVENDKTLGPLLGMRKAIQDAATYTC